MFVMLNANFGPPCTLNWINQISPNYTIRSINIKPGLHNLVSDCITELENHNSIKLICIVKYILEKSVNKLIVVLFICETWMIFKYEIVLLETVPLYKVIKSVLKLYITTKKFCQKFFLSNQNQIFLNYFFLH